MIIGILSDSHFKDYEVIKPSDYYKKVYRTLQKEFAEVDSIIHAGDVVANEFLYDLEKIAPVNVVRGNMDSMNGNVTWPKNLVLTFGKIKIGITHNPNNIRYFENDDINVLILGHLHIPMIENDISGRLIVNPGSLTEPRVPPSRRFFDQDEDPKPSIAFLTIDEEDQIFSAVIRKLKY